MHFKFLIVSTLNVTSAQKSDSKNVFCKLKKGRFSLKKIFFSVANITDFFENVLWMIFLNHLIRYLMRLKYLLRNCEFAWKCFESAFLSNSRSWDKFSHRNQKTCSATVIYLTSNEYLSQSLGLLEWSQPWRWKTFRFLKDALIDRHAHPRTTFMAYIVQIARSFFSCWWLDGLERFGTYKTCSPKHWYPHKTARRYVKAVGFLWAATNNIFSPKA